MKVPFIGVIAAVWDRLRGSPAAQTGALAPRTVSNAASEDKPFTDVELKAASEYFAAARQVVQLFDSIRSRQIATDAEKTIESFDRAERNHIWLGMRAIFPPATRCVASMDADILIGKKLLVRFGDGERVVRYAPAIRKQLQKLRAKHHPKELDSARFNLPQVSL
ncbi:MAG: hypothetical protein KGS72_26360 [Cyanobacteria bacterium REEB67]|nr:hypothetical protein [Cyanobacteria bacterium REEB67]